MSLFPTRLQIKAAHAEKLPFSSLDKLNGMIQEMQDRLYEAGVAPGSRREIEVDFSTERTTWNGVETVQLSVSDYDGLAGVRDNEKPNSKKSWKVRDVEVEHQSPGSGQAYFLDHGIHDVSGTEKRIYQVPYALKDNTDTFRFLMKIQSPIITADTDEVRVKSLYVAKLGLLAIGYEDQGDPRAPQAIANFLSNASQGQKRLDGNKHRWMSLNTGLRRRPTNRM